MSAEFHDSGTGLTGRDSGRAVVLVVLCMLVYALSSGAHAYSADEITNYAAARATVQTGTPDLGADHPFRPEQLLPVRHPDSGFTTTRYGLLSWVPLVPLHALAQATGSVPEPPSRAFPETSHVLPLAALLFNPVVAALLVGLTYLLGREVGLRPWHAVFAALVVAFGSPVWVYAKTLANVPLAATFLTASLLAAGRARRGALAWTLASGLLAGLAALVRPEFIFVALVIGPLATLSGAATWPSRLVRALAWGSVWAATVVPGVGLYNFVRLGTFAYAGDPPATFLFQTDRAYIGLFGILASPSVGLFVFMPVAVIGILGLLASRLDTSMRWALLALVGLAVVGYGTFRFWDGGVSWGPRYLVSSVPMLAIGAAAALAHWRPGLLIRASIAALTLWGVGIAVLGVMFDYQSGWRNLWDAGAKPEQILWNPHFSLIGAHLRLARQWADGFIGLDLYLPNKLGVWVVPALSVSLLLVVALAVIVESRGLTGHLMRSVRRKVTAAWD